MVSALMRTLFAHITALLLLAPHAVSAQVPSIIKSGITGCDFQTGKLSAACIPNFIASIVVFIYGLIGLFFIANIMYAGYQIAFAGAGIMDEGAGKQRLKWSILGFIITVSSYLILSAIISIFSAPFAAPPPAP